MGKNLDVREDRTEGAAAAGERRDLPAENKMGVMPVNRLLISMSLPMMVSMLVQALYICPSRRLGVCFFRLRPDSL